MARHSLKVVKKVNNAQISTDGYIKIVDSIVLNAAGFDDFCGDEEDTGFTKWRTKLVADLADGAGAVIKTEADDGSMVTVDKTNTRMRANKDEPLTTATAKKCKVTVSMPATALASDGSGLSYVEDYVKEFMTLYTEGMTFTWPVQSDMTKKVKAWKFMFGAMLLTKCR